MKEPRRRRGLSGTVLIMILTVMVVLIIMLMATLTVVTTANQRIYTKFEENQAYYTARSALDVFTQNMLADDNYYFYDGGSAKVYVHGDNKTTDKMTQGLALQLDLYKITAQSGYNIKQTDLTAYANTVSVSSEKRDEYKLYYGTDSTAVEHVGTPGSSDYAEYIRYQIEFPQVASASNSYGKLVDEKTLSGTTKVQAAEIKVEVLDRSYNIGTYTDGGTSQTVPDADKADFFAKTGSYTSVTDAMIAEAVFNGKRSKDTMRVKITATVTFMDTEGTAILIYDTDEPPVNNSSRAITAFGSAKMTNHTYIVGGISMLGDPADAGYPLIAWRNGGGVYGAVYNEVGIDFAVSSEIYLTECEYLFVGDDMQTTNDVKIEAQGTITGKDKRPFIYVGGTLTPGNQFAQVGGTLPGTKVDLLTHGINWNGGNSFVYNGDIYCDGSAVFNSTAGTPNIDGDLYVSGDLTVGGNAVQLDGFGNVIGVNFGTNCNIYVGGNLLYNGAPRTVSSVSAFSPSTLTLPAVTVINDVTQPDLEIEVTLPGGVKKVLDTHKSNYDNYYAIDNTGAYIDVDGDGNTPDRKTAEDLAAEDFTNPSFLPGDVLSVATTSIDTSSGNTKFIVYGSNHTGNSYGTSGSPLKITGGGTAELILKANGVWNNTFSANIVVDDDTTLKIYGGDAGTPSAAAVYNLDRFTVWTQTTYDAYKNGTTLNVGSATGHNIKVPKIYYYFSKYTTVDLANGWNFLTGYFFGPHTFLHPSAGSNIQFADLKYNGAPVPSSWKYTVLGSVLCDNFDMQNDHGVIYINPDLDDDGDAGKPPHNWEAYQYVRY